jgi:hypothetical protein
MSSNPYRRSFKAALDLRKWDYTKHCSACLRFFTKSGRLLLATMDPSTPGANADKCWTQLRGAWLISIDGVEVSPIAAAQEAFAWLSETSHHTCTLVFSHPHISPDISNRGVPIMSRDNFSQFTHNQLNHHHDLLHNSPCSRRIHLYDITFSGNVRNYTTWVMHLTCGCLLRQDDWSNWQHLEYLQLDQYFDQDCFGNPTSIDKDDTVFHLVWTYNIKALDGRKKARCVCNGLSRSNLVKVLNKIYANCVDQTSSHLFYAVVTAKNLLVYGSNVCNAFAKAPPQKQGSTSGPTEHLLNGGRIIKVDPPSLWVTSSPSYLQCRATRNPPASGRSTPMPYYATLASRPWYTSHVYTLASSTGSRLSSNAKLMTLQ